jgi:hypothetical protein
MTHTSRTPAGRFDDVPVASVSQLGGIETSVLDNGPGRGVRIAWVNTGGGLRYKVVLDRGLDIADAEFRGESLTWHSPTGITAPSHAYDRGAEWLRSFFGGLMTSCGPMNVGPPLVENGVEYGVHGTHSNTPATVEAVVNPDLSAGRHEMSISGVVRAARVFGPNLELRRTITSTLGEPIIRIHDRFRNFGNQPAPLAWVLHINFGYPLLEPGESVYCYRGRLTPRDDSLEWFKAGHDFRTAPRPLDAHRAGGEVFTYVDPETDAAGLVTAALVNRKRGVAVKIQFAKADYPRLGNWQHWGPAGSYTGALEPLLCGVEGREKDRQRGWYRELQPGETSEHRCTISVVSEAGELEALAEGAVSSEL